MFNHKSYIYLQWPILALALAPKDVGFLATLATECLTCTVLSMAQKTDIF